MPISITVPRLGWSMEAGTFVEWIKADGDPVRPGDPVFRLEGEKSVEEVESLDAGILSIPPDGPKPGDRVVVGAVIGYLLQAGEAPPPREPLAGPEESTPPAVEPAASPSVRRKAREHGVDLRTLRGTGRDGRVVVEDVERAAQTVPTADPAISPRARRLATRHGLDWCKLRGTGRTGRIRERDVAAAIRTTGAQPRDTSGSAPLPGPAQAPTPAQPGLIPLTPTRKAIATRMTESHRTTAPVTLTAAVDASNLVNLREQFKAVGATDERPVPSYTDFLVKLAGFALQTHPLLAARWTDAGLLPAGQIDIGVAVDTDAGLLVPVIRDVPALGLRALAARSRELIDRARRGQLPAREMEGGCFTVTNLGGYGVDAFTPIINLPECAILGVGRIERRPAMRGDRVVGRPQVTLSLTFDHRIVDGAPAARFLQTLAGLIETPAAWLST
jgi:pyruvate dehydrogenase E2 component (dihydrolipoamide acetyltransferase)